MNFIRHIFRRKVMRDPVRTMRIDGVKTPVTPVPDDAELAATALLEHMCDVRGKREDTEGKHQPSDTRHQISSTHDAQYYRELSEKIKAAHEADKHAAMRYVAYCEEELKHQPSDISHLTSLEHGLFKHQDTVEREGGDLLKRWQKCLAECIVKQMTEYPAEDTEDADNTNTK